MKPKRISIVDRTPIRVVLVTMDPHLATAAQQADEQLRRSYPGLTLVLHAAAEWGDNEAALQRVCTDIEQGDIVVATMLFLEDHFRPVLEALRARREHCDTMVCAMCAGEVMRLTRMGDFSMGGGSRSAALTLLQKLRPKPRQGAGGAQQMKMLRRIPQILRFIPGTAQDVRAYFTTLQYWLAGSEANLVNMVRLLVDRYAAGERRGLRGVVKVEPPVEYPEVGLYHPRLKDRVTARLEQLPGVGGVAAERAVGLLVLRSYVLAGNTAHYDGVIAALEARGLKVIPAYASGLDARPAIEQYFMDQGRSRIHALVSLTGFSLVGGPAYNDASAAEQVLARLDVPYLVAHPVEFQTLDAWESSERGLLPVESTIMVAIPELDGSTGSMVFGGRSGANSRDMRVHEERAGVLAARVDKLVRLRRQPRAERKLAVVIFNFPPNAGNTGTAAYLGVFESLWNTLRALRAQGYQVTLPRDVDALREQIVTGNAQRFGAHANVHCRIGVDDHIRRERYLREIEAQWGPAPGRQQADDRSIFVLGATFGNVFVGVQPAFGYEGDPMRLLFEKGFAPTHAFSAFYRWIREDFGASAVLHFGTHGALEFMPGKQTGLSQACWPDRMIGDVPNIYLYAANNPSEGTIAKRRAAATLVSYLTPPISHSGLYRGLLDLKDSISQWNGLEVQDQARRDTLAPLIQAQAATVELGSPAPAWAESAPHRIAELSARILELEYTLIPQGLHVVGEVMSPAACADMLSAIALASFGLELAPQHARQLVDGVDPARVLENTVPALRSAQHLESYRTLADIAVKLAQETELTALLQALDGRYIRPVAGGDVLRSPNILPTGRNLHGFDPFRIPSEFAVREGASQAQLLLDTYMAEGRALPESVALVLWGTDNLKTEGSAIGQALALLGARPRFDGYGRLAGAALLPLAELGRPRVDVVITLSGIFRDLLPLQIRLLAEAAYLAAAADEPLEMNFVRKHALRDQAAQNCDLETAALRVFGNCEGAYGSNVNHLVENGRWEDEDELAETYTRRKSFAFGRKGVPVQQSALLKSVLADVAVTYQNLDSVELGLTTVDHYFDTLGGISRAVRRAKGGQAPAVYIGDQTQGRAKVRTLAEQVSLETHTRMLNPKWYSAMLSHGYEGVRQIETHITNTVGWSATTGEVAPWVYKQLTETYVLDPLMREQLASLNPTASAKVASRLLEASERHYWEPDPETLEALRRAGEELEDRIEGVFEGVAA